MMLSLIKLGKIAGGCSNGHVQISLGPVHEDPRTSICPER